MKIVRFYRIHCQKSALYLEQTIWQAFDIDDEEILAELNVFSATLTPLA